MDKPQDTLEARNKQMKKILEQTGGVQRWCPIIILFVIPLSLIGYYQIVHCIFGFAYVISFSGK